MFIKGLLLIVLIGCNNSERSVGFSIGLIMEKNYLTLLN